MPRLAVSHRTENGQLRARKQQSLPLRIFFHCVDWSIRQTLNDLYPRGAAVGRSEDVRLLIAEPDAVHGNVSRADIEMARVDLRDLAPRVNLRRRDVLPRFTAVTRDVDQAVVGSRPDRVDVFRRGR